MTRREIGREKRVLGALGRSLFKARTFGVELYSLLLALKDSRTPWYARLLGLLMAAYVISPIDLAPELVPLFGILDDLILVPLGIKAVSNLIPGDVRAEARGRAVTSVVTRPRFWRWIAIVATIATLAWLGLLLLISVLLVMWLF